MGWWASFHVFGDRNPFRDHIVFYCRFIDDLIFIWEGDLTTLLLFVDSLNKNDFDLKFTFTYDYHHLKYLDLLLYVDLSLKIHTDIFRKENSRKTYLRADSCHPRSLIKGIPKGQLMRVKHNCSKDEDVHRQSDDLQKRFLARGYRSSDLIRARGEVDLMDRKQLLIRKPKKVSHISDPLFITQFSQQAQEVRFILEKHWDILRLDPLLGQNLPSKPKVVFRRAKTISNSLYPVYSRLIQIVLDPLLRVTIDAVPVKFVILYCQLKHLKVM
ncbi:hypothetical protein FKM82_005215 [Ascaphus truei]